MRKISFPILLIVLISGCATTANYEKILQGWVGSNVDNLVRSWGPPQSSFKLSDGEMVIEYVRSGTVQEGGFPYTTTQTTHTYGLTSSYGTYGTHAYGTYSGTNTTYVQHRTPTYTVSLICRTRFTVNKAGIITSWKWQGNNCKAHDPNG